MKTKIYLGKTEDNNKCYVELNLEKGENGLIFSAMGEIWQVGMRDMIAGGQNLDDLLELFPTREMGRIHDIWKLYHLNDLNAGCEHQKALGWDKEGYKKHTSESCPVCGYKYGSAWKFEEIPDYVIKEIKSIMKSIG